MVRVGIPGWQGDLGNGVGFRGSGGERCGGVG